METILIVEDNRTYARTTANWLTRNGVNTRYVLSANAAKEFLRNNEVDRSFRISVSVIVTAWNCSNG